MSNFQLISLPFKASMRVEFAHASAVRGRTQSLLVLACPRTGDFNPEQVGIGEGCPREYVTGESEASVAEFCATHREDLESNVANLDDLRNWMNKHTIEIDQNLAAFCAIEGAIIDFFARQKGQTIDTCLGLPPLHGHQRYSAVLGDSRPGKFWLQTIVYWLAGFQDFKVKLSGDHNRDRSKFAIFKWLRKYSDIRLRADANNFWTDPQSCISYIRELEMNFWAIEEPVKAGDSEGQENIARELDVKIILDESLLHSGQLTKLNGIGNHMVANIRVSKNGGLLRSMEIAQQAINMQIPLIIGAHVGETSILTRSGMTIANCFRDSVIAQEGGFGRLLIKQDAVCPSLHFGRRGVLDLDKFLPADYYGSGLVLTSELFDQISPTGS
jgi:L-alanine-DL-glutamate epimerase-like enolase superfamily enzyme